MSKCPNCGKTACDTDEMIIQIANAIKARTTYGMRTEIAPERCSFLQWSNASGGWMLSRSTVPKGKEVKLDANQIIVPFPKEQVAAILEFLPDLPLYDNSFERVWERPYSR